jgi:hypothetical protein
VLAGAGPLLQPVPAEADPDRGAIPLQREHATNYLSTPDQ